MQYIMLRVLGFIGGLVLMVNVCAQETMSTKLNNWARGAERNATEQVWLQFEAQLDYEALDLEFRRKKYSNEQRAQAVIQASQNMHNRSIEELHKTFGKVSIQEDFWLGNSVIIELDKKQALELANNSLVRWMELTSENQIGVEDTEIEQSDEGKESINGAEPGLKAINAHKMWARGYTGKGRKALIIDTGVWPNHPSIADAWVGNREPASHSWFGFDSPVPIDKTGSHGTHVTGTVLGLDPANNDTVGVAFDATFMAADPVATQTGERKGLYSTIRAFQWVLDQDNFSPGLPYVRPDVINNSWGRSIEDSPDICTSPFGDAVAACQLAGIAVVWSAGNNGPGQRTIGAPATITRNPYLVFTVGAINGNTPSYPIASFSSRGPSYCAQAGIDSIKPEVVAPGVAVRSAVGHDGYENKQGTSMAGPHVAGALLLLKEAFPNLPGQDILEALYLTATDVGPSGEDIAYGNGLIDVDSAFLWLSTQHTASLPQDYSQDVSIELVSISDNGISCLDEVEAEFKIINHSDSIIDMDSLVIVPFVDYGQGASVDGTKSLSQNLNPGDSVLIKMKCFNANKQNTEFGMQIRLGLPKSNNPFNDKAYAKWKNIGEENIPFSDDFFFHKTEKWIVDNPDNDHTWSVRVWEDNGIRNEALQLDFYNMRVRNNQQDFLVSSKLMVNGNQLLQMSFDYSYTSKKSDLFADSLSVEVTTSCNTNWKSVWSKSGADLATTGDSVVLFVPKQNQWESAIIDLSDYDDSEYIQVRLVGTNAFGNNLYVDNIAITSLQPAGVEDIIDNDVLQFFPNPNTGLLNISGDLNSYTTLRVIDITGKTIIESPISGVVDISELENGVYIIEAKGSAGISNAKIVKE
mgnify:CR=1 FL=1